MATVTTLKQEGKEISNGLTRIDLVKHTLKKIISVLGDEDVINLITFSYNAEIIFDNLKMTEHNKIIALEKIEKYLYPSGNTNIWDGLRVGLELMYKMRNIMSNSSILLLTDGCPNIDPPMGYDRALNNVREHHKLFTENNFVCNIHTFGYGNELDSNLLRQISNIGQGEFNFIPDASFVGTIFINALTNIMLTHTISTQIKIDYENNHSICINGGSILYEQDRTIIVPIDNHKITNITINYQDYYSKKNKNISINPVNATLDISEQNNLYNHYVRTELVKLLEQTLNQDIKTINYQEIIYKLKTFVTSINNSTHNYIKDLIKDIQGEIMMAFSEEYFNKWGKHYLYSISKAHEAQLRNNFKDPGVQHYCVAKIYDTIREKINDIFNSLPAPKP